MTKAVLNDLINLENETSVVKTINANNAVIETAFDNTLSRDGASPNQMLTNLDMNSRRIINLPSPVIGTEPIRMQDVTDFNTGLSTLESVVNGLVIGSGSTMVGITASGIIATSIPNGVSSIQTSGYYTAGDGGQALYVLVGAPVSGCFQLVSSNSKRWQLSENIIDPRMTGAKGDGVTDDTPTINFAKAHAWANNKTLGFSDGTYITTSTLEFARSGFHVLALGGQVIIKNTSSSAAVVSFDGSTTGSPSSITVDQTFGGPNRFYLDGSVANAYGLFTKQIIHSNFRVNGRNTQACVRTDFVVLNTYDIICSGIESSFVNPPIWGLYAERAFDCQITVIAEVLVNPGNSGIYMTECSECTVHGTAESMSSGGIRITSSCNRNTFIGFDVEVNALSGSGFDWLIEGDSNTFIGCGGTATYLTVNPASTVSGAYNTFINCDMEGMTVTGASNTFLNCNLFLSFVNSGVHTFTKNCIGVADSDIPVYPPNSAPIIGNTNTGQTAPSTTKYISTAGLSGTEFLVQIPMTSAGTISRLFIQSAGSPGGAGETYAAVMRKNGANQSIACNITTGLSTASDLTHTFTVAAGDLVSLAVTSTASAPATNIIWGWQFNAT